MVLYNMSVYTHVHAQKHFGGVFAVGQILCWALGTLRVRTSVHPINTFSGVVESKFPTPAMEHKRPSSSALPVSVSEMPIRQLKWSLGVQLYALEALLSHCICRHTTFSHNPHKVGTVRWGLEGAGRLSKILQQVGDSLDLNSGLTDSKSIPQVVMD